MVQFGSSQWESPKIMFQKCEESNLGPTARSVDRNDKQRLFMVSTGLVSMVHGWLMSMFMVIVSYSSMVDQPISLGTLRQLHSSVLIEKCRQFLGRCQGNQTSWHLETRGWKEELQASPMVIGKSNPFLGLEKSLFSVLSWSCLRVTSLRQVPSTSIMGRIFIHSISVKWNLSPYPPVISGDPPRWVALR